MAERRALVVRLDSAGGVLLSGPAIRAVAAACGPVTLLTESRCAEVARLLPGVGQVLIWQSPGLAERLREARFTDALVLDESPVAVALLLRLVGVERIATISDDQAGLPAAERGLALGAAAGFVRPEEDDGKPAVRRPLPPVRHLVGDGPYVALHPGVSAPVRRWPAERWAQAVHELCVRGRRTVVTGGPGEVALTILVAGRIAVNLGGRTNWGELAAVLAGASAVVARDTGPAHLAMAVGTPIVSPASADTRAEDVADKVHRLLS